MKKRIAVLTTHRCNNYGAVLQSYALSHKVSQLCGDCEVLDYRCPIHERMYHSCRPIYSGRDFLIKVRNCVFRTIRRFCRDRATIAGFKHFRENHLVISSEKYETAEQLAKAETRYDVFLVGSDQIWNPANTTGDVKTFDQTYFLNFVRDGHKKKSYAASIGLSAVGEELAEIYRKQLKDFSTLTLREHKGAELIQAILGRETHAVCDPVLLLEPSEWQQVEREVKLVSKDYILVYNPGGGKLLDGYATALAAEKHCDVYYIQPPIVRPISVHKRHILTGVGPAEFVWLIRNAHAVVTSSFHCSAFALLFGKQLHFSMDHPQSEHQRNSRLESLFIFFGVAKEQIMWNAGSRFPLGVIIPTRENQNMIAKSREESLQILREMLVS